MSSFLAPDDLIALVVAINCWVEAGGAQGIKPVILNVPLIAVNDVVPVKNNDWYVGSVWRTRTLELSIIMILP